MLDVSPSNWLNYKSTLVTPDKGCLYTNVNLKSSRNRFRIYEWVQNGKVKVTAYGMQHGGMHFSSCKDLMADSGLVAISISLSLYSEPFSVAYFLSPPPPHHHHHQHLLLSTIGELNSKRPRSSGHHYSPLSVTITTSSPISHRLVSHLAPCQSL